MAVIPLTAIRQLTSISISKLRVILGIVGNWLVRDMQVLMVPNLTFKQVRDTLSSQLVKITLREHCWMLECKPV
jgi:hypothetical protein